MVVTYLNLNVRRKNIVYTYLQFKFKWKKN